MKSVFTSPLLRLCVVIGLMSSAAGCETIEAPFFEPNFLSQLPADAQCLFEANKTEAFPAGQAITKKVLIEEMTGHKCGNCPEATEVAYALYSETFADQAVFVGIHAGPLATFVATANKYFTNFTSEHGDELYTTLNPNGVVPFTLIDRTTRNSNPGSWPTAVADRAEQTPVAGIRIFNCFDLDSLKGSAVVDLKFLEDASASSYLSVWLIEDDVIDWQKDYRAPGGKIDIEDYSHHQVFRAALNTPEGAQIKEAGGIEAGETFQLSYGFELSETFDPANCKIVAFVYDKDTGEVGQVEQLPIL